MRTPDAAVLYVLCDLCGEHPTAPICGLNQQLGETTTLRGRTLEFRKTWLERVGIEENSTVMVELEDREWGIEPPSEDEAAQERLLAHLSLPVGAPS